MKNAVKVNPLSCRCKLSKLVSHLKQVNSLISSPAPQSHSRANQRTSETVAVQYI